MRSIYIVAFLFLFALPLTIACDNGATRDDDRPTEQERVEEETTEAEYAEQNDRDDHPALLDPSLATEEAPEQFQILFETTEGDFTVEVNRSWAPNGADRLYNLVRIGFYDDVAFFRVIEGFMAQFGIHSDPEVNAVWRQATIPDDPVEQSNERGKLTFATSGPDSRTTQLFINFTDNANLDGMGFAPVGEVIEGMDVVDSLYSGYGEGAPRGQGPDQGRIQNEGNEYLGEHFEELDYTTNVSFISD